LIFQYGIVKATSFLRSSVMLIPEATMSIFLVFRLGMIPSQSIGWCFTLNFISFAIQSSAFTSKPSGTPDLSTNANGGKFASIPLMYTFSAATAKVADRTSNADSTTAAPQNHFLLIKFSSFLYGYV